MHGLRGKMVNGKIKQACSIDMFILKQSKSAILFLTLINFQCNKNVAVCLGLSLSGKVQIVLLTACLTSA